MYYYDRLKFYHNNELVNKKHEGFTLLDFCELFSICPIKADNKESEFYTETDYSLELQVYNHGFRESYESAELILKNVFERIARRRFIGFSFQTPNINLGGLREAVPVEMIFKFQDGIEISDAAIVAFTDKLEDQVCQSVSLGSSFHLNLIRGFIRYAPEPDLQVREENIMKWFKSIGFFDDLKAYVAACSLADISKSF